MKPFWTDIYIHFNSELTYRNIKWLKGLGTVYDKITKAILSNLCIKNIFQRQFNTHALNFKCLNELATLALNSHFQTDAIMPPYANLCLSTHLSRHIRPCTRCSGSRGCERAHSLHLKCRNTQDHVPCIYKYY